MASTQEQHSHDNVNLKDISFPVEGMECAACAVRIEKQLMKREGVSTASVNLANRKASVRYNPNQINIEGLIASIERTGFSVPKLEHPSEYEAQSRDAYSTLFRRFLICDNLNTASIRYLHGPWSPPLPWGSLGPICVEQPQWSSSRVPLSLEGLCAFCATAGQI